MSFWLTAQAKSKISVFLLRKNALRAAHFFALPTAKAVLLSFAVMTAMTMMATPVFADTTDVTNNVVVYDNREKSLKITEISLSHDYTSMSVLVENIQTKANFRIEHELDTEDTLNEHIEITATDGMGNVSETVNIKNPFYAPEIAEPTPEPEPIKGSLSVTGSNNGESKEITETENEPIPTDFSTDDKPSDNSGFNTSGWASIVDNAVSGNKEFLIVRSETGSEFYIVIDRENDKDNVYFLNAVTEWDLLGLTEKYEVSSNLNPDSELNNIVGTENTSGATDSQETQGNNVNQNDKQTTESNENSTTDTPKQAGGSIFGIMALVLFALAVGAYFYFFKIKRKTQNTDNDDFLPDNYGDNDDEDEGEEEDEDEDSESSEEDEDEDNELESPSPEIKSTTPIPKPDTETDNAEKDVGTDNDVGDSEEDVGFTDDDVGDTEYGESSDYDDYVEEIDEDEVLGGIGGDEDDEEEDNTV